jgi:nucleotide-binding universal stress UspA family protein
MFKRVLLPVDGSELSGKAVRQAVEYARGTQAEVVALYASPDYHPVTYEDFVPPDFLSPERFSQAADRRAVRILAPVQKACEKAGVACRTVHVVDDSPWEAIIAAAKKHRCDLIVMASHGRRGLSGLLLGSETAKVLTHSRTPVLVLR